MKTSFFLFKCSLLPRRLVRSFSNNPFKYFSLNKTWPIILQNLLQNSDLFGDLALDASLLQPLILKLDGQNLQLKSLKMLKNSCI